MATALLEDMLRKTVLELSGNSDYTWFLFEGRTLDWLARTAIQLLDEVSPARSRFGEEVESSFIRSIKRVEKVRVLRNDIIHGRWDDAPIMDPEDVLPRPYGNSPPGDVWICRTSRFNKYMVERKFTVEDVLRAAAEANEVSTEIWATYSAMVAARKR
ncbi:MAG: hypothetical protein WCD35_04625 [Mycobacteriales bacterium]